MDAAPSLNLRLTREGHELAAAGAWTATNAASLETAIERAAQEAVAIRELSVNMGGIASFDTYGAWLLERLIRERSDAGLRTEVTSLRDQYQGLLRDVHDVNLQPVLEPESGGLIGAFQRYADGVVSFLTGMAPYLHMLGAICLSFLRVLRNPRLFRFTSAIHQIDRVGWQAVPIIILMTFLIGCIIAQQGFFHFRRFGADTYVVDMVGILISREIGVLLVTIMVAGRSGSSYTAELGSMKMREEVDALLTMGLNPVDVLILPRVLALVIAVPVLSFLGLLAALYGAGLVALLYNGMSPDIFIARLHDAVTVTHFKVGMIKAPFMALVIGIIACAEGLRVKGSSESLGLQTTQSVVKSIFLVIVLDGLFAIFFASIGM
jgi:phospholipid/cholesterol/gamma-HCH transport system permease protein